MISIWKLNGVFYGWVTANGNLYSRTGNRIGTLDDNVFYNHNGNYIGELLNENRVGYNPDHSDWLGVICDIGSEIMTEPLENTIPNEVIGYHSPQ